MAAINPENYINTIVANNIGGIMVNLNIQNDAVCFRDIKFKDLPKILGWYNKVDDFKFATGIDFPIELEVLKQKYSEVVISKNEFFVGIYDSGEMIGILKGSIKHEKENIMWIRSIVIESSLQNRGYGSQSINLLLRHMKERNNITEVYLAVIEDNIQGKAFWRKHNFAELRKIQNHLKLQDKPQNVVIMYKKL